jgi:dihydrofolate reductase (trimethoprim resistance protein)
MARFKQGDRVKKKSGSEWKGYIVGWYSTELTKEGYAVESETHKGIVQIYPASALELVTDVGV